MLTALCDAGHCGIFRRWPLPVTPAGSNLQTSDMRDAIEGFRNLVTGRSSHFISIPLFRARREHTSVDETGS